MVKLDKIDKEQFKKDYYNMTIKELINKYDIKENAIYRFKCMLNIESKKKINKNDLKLNKDKTIIRKIYKHLHKGYSYKGIYRIFKYRYGMKLDIETIKDIVKNNNFLYDDKYNIDDCDKLYNKTIKLKND